MNKYRIKTKILPEQNQYLRFNLDQDFDVLDILTLSIYGTDAYPNPCSDWGAIMGRIVDSNSFPMENVKIGYILEIDEDDKKNVSINTLYNSIVKSQYPLLPNYKVKKNHFPIGSFPSEDEVLSNTTLEYVYKKYFKHITSTNQNGDYAILGVPLGKGKLLMNFDSSDAGGMSTTPTQQIAVGQKTNNQFVRDKTINVTPINANSGNIITGITVGYTISATTTVGESTVTTVTSIGGGNPQNNKNNDTISTIQKLDGSGTLISRGTEVQVKSFFGDNDICEIGINRYDFQLEYTYIPVNYIIGSFYSDFNIFSSSTPTYKSNNIAMATSKQSMGGEVIFLTDSWDIENPDASANVGVNGEFIAAIPCSWDRYNIDAEGNWYRTNDDFTKNPTGIFTRTPYCLMLYLNNNNEVKIDSDPTIYSRGSSIGFNLNNWASNNYKKIIGVDKVSTGITTVNRFNINYNAQYYFDSPFPKGYYNPISVDYYPNKSEQNGTKYRNGAELKWDYNNRKSNVYAIATQWSKYGYYAVQSVENSGISGISNFYSNVLKNARKAPLPAIYSTNSLKSGDILVVNLTTDGLTNGQLYLDEPVNVAPQYYSAWYPLDLNTELYPNGHIGNTTPSTTNLSPGRSPQINPGADFNTTNYEPSIGVWGPKEHPDYPPSSGVYTNSVFEVLVGQSGLYKIKGESVLALDFVSNVNNKPYWHFDVYKYSNGVNIKLNTDVPGGRFNRASQTSGQNVVNEQFSFSFDFDFYLQDGDLLYFKIWTSVSLLTRHAARLEKTNIQILKHSTGNVLPLIIGNMYLPTFQATKNGNEYYPVGPASDIFDITFQSYNAVKLSEVDIMLYPLTNEIFNIVEHSQINNPYENGVSNYYFFCNQYWKLRDFIYNETN